MQIITFRSNKLITGCTHTTDKTTLSRWHAELIETETTKDTSGVTRNFAILPHPDKNLLQEWTLMVTRNSVNS